MTTRQPPFFKNNLFYLLGVAAALTLATFLLLMVIQKGDALIFFAHQRTPFRDAYFRFMTHMGEGYVYLATTLVFLIFRYRYAVAMVLNTTLVLSLSQLLKGFFRHERPARYFESMLLQPDMINYVEGVEVNMSWASSFPSGHTTSGFALYGLLAFLSPYQSGKFVCLFLAINVGVSRIYLVQHFLKDVVAGALLGTLIAMLVFYLQDRYLRNTWLDQGLPIRRINRQGK